MPHMSQVAFDKEAMNTPRMTEKELAEHMRRVRISRTKTGWKPKVNGRVRSPNGREARHGTPAQDCPTDGSKAAVPGVRIATHASSPTFATVQTFFIPGPLPGANDIIRKHHMVYSRLKAQWGLTISWSIRSAELKPVGYCRIEFVWHEANNRRDDDNVMFGQKFILDALRDTRIIKDDRRQFVYSLTHRVVVDPSKPGVEVTLVPVCVEVT